MIVFSIRLFPLAGLQPEARATVAALQLTPRSSGEQKHPRFSGGRGRLVNHWRRTLTSIVRQRNAFQIVSFLKKLSGGIRPLLFHKQILCVKNQSDFIFVSDQFYLFKFRLSCQSWAKSLEQCEEHKSFQLTLN